MVETMLATWGLSLFVVGILTMVFGDITEGVPTPLPGITIGAYQASGYSLFVIVFSVATMFGVYIILRSSRLGLLARGTMQNAEMAAALGTDTSRIYAVTFAFGAALAGLAGGVLAPVSGVFPSIGGSYIGRAFITVIGGGAAPLVGTASASLLFGTINQIATFATNPVYGEVALLLAAIGIYGVMAYSFSQRTHEIGIRIALGAQRMDILRLVVGEGMRLVLIGLASGLVGAAVLTRFVRTMLFDVSPSDPLTFAAISGILAGVAFLACYIPARHATRVEPLVALREE